MRIASLTKIMTAIVAIEQGNLSDKVKISKNAAGKEGSSIYLKPGEEISLSNLLYGLMLRSGNDAATAIAEHVGGSVEGFVYLMNLKAELLGLSNTKFMNPSGLDADGHYSSANDLAVLMAYALHNPAFQEIVKTQSKRVTREGEAWDTVWHNKNKMLRLYAGADGGKTGFTKLARRCLVSSATKGNQQFAAVTINDGNDWSDHSRMLDYGFAEFPNRIIINKGESAGTDIITQEMFIYPATDKEMELFRKDIKLAAAGSIESRLGKVGRLYLYLQDKPIGSVPLESKVTSVHEKTMSNQGNKQQPTSFVQRSTAIFVDILRLLATGE